MPFGKIPFFNQKGNIASNDKDYSGIREAVKQIRYALNKSNDKIQELKLLPVEYEAYYNSLSWGNSYRESIDKFILCLNSITNGHGTNVGRSFLVTISVSAIMYSVYCLFLGFTLGNNFTIFLKNASCFLEFLNPLHKPEYLVESLLGYNKVKPSAIAWEGFSKIINTFLIYQFIQSFRKFGKS
jgi:hypothetical protein